MSQDNLYQWSLLLKAQGADKLPQAFLFSGESGLGKKEMALQFIKYLNCQTDSQDKKPCLNCSVCKMIEKGQHPDIFLIAPEKKEIQIDQIRQLQQMLINKANFGGYKAVVIDQAHTLNIASQNCLLKTLEEPAGATIFFLISDLPNKFLPTILSRCEQIKFYPAGPKIVEEEKLQEMEKFLSKTLADKFALTKKMFSSDQEAENKRNELMSFLETMKNYFRILILQKLKVNSEFFSNASPLNNFNFQLNEIKERIEKVGECQELIASTNINLKLAFENLLINL